MRYSVTSESSRCREQELQEEKEPEAALLLVRARGDPTVEPGYDHYFGEKDGDKRVKAALESCLGHGLKLGPFKAYSGIV